MTKQALLKRDITLIAILALLFLTFELLHTSWFCPFFDGIGIPDPGCGFTSATKALLRGDLVAAFYHHPLVYLAPFIVLYYGYSRYYLKTLPKYDQHVIIVVMVVFFVVYVLRLFGLITNSASLVLNPNALLPQFIRFIMNSIG